VAHQIRYLEQNGLHNIYVVIHVDSRKKVEQYLREHFKPHENTTLVLVVVHEEETDSAHALKLMQSLQKE
jgi:NDP-sugar pyrophosphorylase family protein